MHIPFEQAMGLGPGKRGQGEIQQRGMGAYTLCGPCNNRTGKWYGAAFADWCHQVAGLPILRAVAAGAADDERRDAAWLLAQIGDGADAAVIADVLGAGPPLEREIWRAGMLVSIRAPRARTVCGALLASHYRAVQESPGPGDWEAAASAVEKLGKAAVPDAIPLAAALLWQGTRARLWARWFLTFAPQFGTVVALTGAGLLPEVEVAGRGRLAAGSAIFRCRKDGTLLRTGGVGGGEAEARLRAANRALNAAWRHRLRP